MSTGSPQTREPTRLLSIRQVCNRVPYHRVYIHRLVARGAFPKPVKTGKRRNGWIEAEVEAWIAERIARRDADASEDGGQVPASDHKDQERPLNGT